MTCIRRPPITPSPVMYFRSPLRRDRVRRVLHELIRRYPLGPSSPRRPTASRRVTFRSRSIRQVAPHGLLRCHVARANPLWRACAAATRGARLFQGGESYVSPSWYAAKQQHGKVVPTWDYVVVHAYGEPRRDPRRRSGCVSWSKSSRTVTKPGRAEPWQVSDAPAEYVDKLLQAIVGIEIPIARLLGKWKVSQNRSPPIARASGAVSASTASPEREMAHLIGRTL